MGSYPSLRAIESLDEPPGAILATTAMDGLVRIAGKTETHAALPGQLGSDDIECAESSVLGLLFTHQDDPYDGARPWVLRNGEWQTVTRFPEEPPKDWSRHDLVVEPDGEVMSVTMVPGVLITARWRGDKATVLGREQTEGSLPIEIGGTFVTPDHEIWAAQGDKLERLINGKWQRVYTLPGAERDNQVKDLGGGRFQLSWDEDRWIGGRLVVVDRSGPPWTLLERGRGRLWNLSYVGSLVRNPRLERVPMADDQGVLDIHDAIASAPGELILATDRGLKSYTTATGKLAPSPLAEAASRTVKGVTSLCRDGLGRLWVGGEGLAVWEPQSARLHSLDELPMLGQSPVSALAAEAGAPDGIAAVLEERGVVFLRVARSTQFEPGD
jgi:hypothetical protein